MKSRYSFASSPMSRISAATAAVAFTVTLFLSVALGITGELPTVLQIAGLAVNFA